MVIKEITNDNDKAVRGEQLPTVRKSRAKELHSHKNMRADGLGLLKLPLIKNVPSDHNMDGFKAGYARDKENKAAEPEPTE